MKLYGGVDLHSNNSVIVLSDDDKVIYRRRLPNDIELVRAELAPFAEDIEGLVVESTYNWYWLVDGLMEVGYRVHLADTAAIVQYEGLKYADDDDARWLAKLLRLGVLPEGYIYPKDERPVRDLLRRRARLMQQAHRQPAVGAEPAGTQPGALAQRQPDQAVELRGGGQALAGCRPGTSGQRQPGGNAHLGGRD